MDPPAPGESNASGADASFASQINATFGWLRKQPSEMIPWWLPSTESVPEALAQPEETARVIFIDLFQ